MTTCARLRGPGLLLGLLLVFSGRVAGATLDLIATPPRVPADGQSVITLSAVVREGVSLIRTDVDVLFTTSSGTLVPLGGATGSGQQMRVRTQGGRAQVQLRATTYETSAVVTAGLVDLSQAAPAVATVVFGLNVQVPQYDNIIKLNGTFLTYYPESQLQVIDVIGDASITYQGIEIHAPRLQLDLQEYTVIGKDFQGRVTVGLGPPPYKTTNHEGPNWSGDALVMDLKGFTGALFSAAAGQTFQFSGRALRKVEGTPLPQDAFDVFQFNDAKIKIVARRALVYPNQKIRLDMPKFKVGDQKVLSLPYYFEPLGYNVGASGGGGFTQFVNYSSQDGILVNFPYYFDMSDRETNEFTLDRGTRSGVFGRTAGWQVYYRHHADLKHDRGDWDFTVDQLGSKFGVDYTRNQRFDTNTFGSVSVAWPEHRNLYTNSNIYTVLGPGSLSATTNVDHLLGIDGGFSANANMVWQSYPMRMTLIDSRFSLALGAGYSRTLAGQDSYRQSVSVSWDHDAWMLGKSASITPYAGARFQNTVNGGQEAGFTFNTTYRQELMPGMNLNLGYTFDTTWNSLFKVPDRHVFSLDWQMDGSRWRGYAYSSYNLVDRSLSASVLFDYSLTPHWGLQAQTVYQSSPLGSFSETEFWAYRLVGARELRLRYNLERGRIFFEIDNHF